MIKDLSKILCFLAVAGIVASGCSKKRSDSAPIHFTKIDSLTENYLAYNDSILQAWNVMINDDNQKIKSMRYLLHELMVTNEFNKEDLQSLDERLHKLLENRYTTENFSPEIIEEYDFAANSLVTEITSMAQQYSNYDQSETLQKIVDEILAADERVESYRSDYDLMVEHYNQFIETNQSIITASENLDWKKKQQFSN